MQKIRIYTDGACSGNPGPGGWGFVVNLPEGYEKYNGSEKDTTNNRMELTAVIQALKLVCKSYEAYDCIEVSSDSAYIVNAVNQGWLVRWLENGWKTARGEEVKNSDLWKELYKEMYLLKKKKKVIEIVKVKGHAGNLFNEVADTLARSAAERAKVL